VTLANTLLEARYSAEPLRKLPLRRKTSHGGKPIAINLVQIKEVDTAAIYKHGRSDKGLEMFQRKTSILPALIVGLAAAPALAQHQSLD